MGAIVCYSCGVNRREAVLMNTSMKQCTHLEKQSECPQYLAVTLNNSIEYCSHWRHDILGDKDRICDAPAESVTFIMPSGPQ